MSVTFDHCVIAVTDWEASNAFYRDVIGCEVVEHGAGFAYRLGAQQLNVHGPGVERTRWRRPGPPGNSDLCFRWDGPIADAVAHLERHRVAVDLGPVERHGAPAAARACIPRPRRLAPRVHHLEMSDNLCPPTVRSRTLCRISPFSPVTGSVPKWPLPPLTS